MPLMKSPSKQAMSQNIATEMRAGKPQKQAIAIAYATKRKAGKRKKMNKGGMLGEEMLEKHLPGDIQGTMDEQGHEMMMSQGGMVIDPLDGQMKDADELSKKMTHQKRDNMQPVIREQAYKEGRGHTAEHVGGDKPNANGLEREFANGGEVDDGPTDEQMNNLRQAKGYSEMLEGKLKHGSVADHPSDEPTEDEKIENLGRPDAQYASGGLVDKHSSYGNENDLLNSVKREMGSKTSKRSSTGDEESIQRNILGIDRADRQTKHLREGDEDDIVSAIMKNRGMKSAQHTEHWGEQDQAYADGGPVGMDDDWDMLGEMHDGSGEMFNEHAEADDVRRYAKSDQRSQMARGGLVESIMQGRRSKMTPQNENPNEFRDEEPKDDFSLSHTIADPEHDVDDDHNDKGIIAQIMRKRKMSKRSRS